MIPYVVKDASLEVGDWGFGAGAVRQRPYLEVGGVQVALDLLADPHVFDLEVAGFQRVLVGVGKAVHARLLRMA